MDEATAQALEAVITQAIDDFDLIIEDLSRQVQKVAELPTQKAAALVFRLARTARLLEFVLGGMDSRVAEAMGNTTAVVEGVGMVSAGRSYSRKGWDHEAIAYALINTIANNQRMLFDEQGDARDPHDIAATAIEQFRVAAANSWRTGNQQGTTGLRAFGIDPDDYSEKTLGPWKLELPK